MQQQKDKEVECPQCRSFTTVADNDPSSLPTVFFINGLIEVYQIMKEAESKENACQSCSTDEKATSFCHTCGFICTGCAILHKTMKRHETCLISEMREGALIKLPAKKSLSSNCQEHEGELRKLYCFKCEQFICRDCTLVYHAGHKFDFVKGVADAFREEVLYSLVSLRDTHTSVKTAIARVEESKRKIGVQGVDLDRIITQSFEELRAILNNCERLMLHKTQEVVGEKMCTLDKQHEDLQVMSATLSSLVEFVEMTAENASDEELISLKQQMTSQVQKVSRKYQDVKLSPNEVAIFVAVPPSTDLAEICKKSSVAEIEGPGLKSAITKQVSKFTVHTHEVHGQSPPIHQHVSAKLKSLVDGSVLQATVVGLTPSTYEVSYTPTTRGRHHLTVQVNNTEIGTFQVFVQHPPTQLGTPVRVIEGVQPYCIALDDNGEVFVTEHLHHRYAKLDSQGRRVLTIGSIGKPPFGARCPTGIATDGEGNVYVTSAHKLQKFNRHGDIVKSVGKLGLNVGEFKYPWGVKYHKHQVYVCDSHNGRVQVLDTNLNFVQSFGTHGDGPGELIDPRDISFDCYGNIYVTDFEKHQLLVFSEDGQYLRYIGQRGQGKGDLQYPVGVCTSGDYVYITEWGNKRISVFCTSGRFVLSFGMDKDEHKHPWSIAIDKDGFIFVCEYDKSDIQVF